MITLQQAEARVALGAYLLDISATGWRDRVNPGTLLTQSGARCPLGQTYGSYFAGIKALGLDAQLASELGFFSEEREDYPKLDMAWGRELAGV